MDLSLKWSPPRPTAIAAAVFAIAGLAAVALWPSRGHAQDQPLPLPGEGLLPLPQAESFGPRATCDDALFFVEVPVASPLPWPDAGAPERAAVALQEMLEPRVSAWFCDGGDVDCDVSQTWVQLDAVLPERNLPGRENGHLRAFRLRFLAPDGTARHVVRRAMCDVIEAIRTAFDQVLPPVGQAPGSRPSDVLNVGRECTVMAHAQEAWASLEARTWHLGATGLPPGSAGPQAQGGRADARVEVALLDGALTEETATALGIQQDLRPTPWHVANGNEAPSQHGTGMAVLLRQAAPGANIVLHRAIDALGTSPIADLAVGLDRALYDRADDSLPLILNMSVGWMPELEYPARLTGSVADGLERDGNPTACTTTEDAVGESVRYVLNLARNLDSQRRPIVAIAAAGNRAVAPAYPESPRPLDRRKDPCGGPIEWTDKLPFFPAGFSVWKTCDGPRRPPRALAIAVNGVDPRGYPALDSMLWANVPLVAPGEHVYADVAQPAAFGATSPSDVAVCDGAPAQPRGPIVLPAVYSGTSTAAVLTSGALARAFQAARSAGPGRLRPPRRRATLPDFVQSARLLWLTGLRTGVQVSGQPFQQRRADFGRLAAVLRDPARAALLNCVGADETPAPLVDATLRTRCRAGLRAVGLWQPDPVAPSPRFDPGPAETPCTAAIPSELLAANCAGADTCTLGHIEGIYDSYSAQAYGPLPGGTWCPDCRARTAATLQTAPAQNATGASLDLTFSVAADLPADQLLDIVRLDAYLLNGQALHFDLSVLGLSGLAAGGAYALPGLTVELPEGITAQDWQTAKLAVMATRHGVAGTSPPVSVDAALRAE